MDMVQMINDKRERIRNKNCRAIIEVLFLPGLKLMSKIITEFVSVPVEIRTTHLPIHAYDVTDPHTRMALCQTQRHLDFVSKLRLSNRFVSSSYPPTKKYFCHHTNTVQASGP